MTCDRDLGSDTVIPLRGRTPSGGCSGGVEPVISILCVAFQTRGDVGRGPHETNCRRMVVGRLGDGGWSVADWRDGALARPPDSDI